MIIIKIALVLIAVAWGLWAFMITKFMSQMLNNNLKYMLEPNVNIMKKSLAGPRYDAIELRRWEVYFGAIFLVPIRFIISFPLFFIIYLMAIALKRSFNVTISNNQVPRGKFYEMATYLTVHPAIIWTLHNLIGIKVTKKKHSIYDFLADYKPKQDISFAPMAVGNHISPWCDSFYMVCEGYSFVARYLMSQVFYLGMFSIARQSLYFKKGSRKDSAVLLQSLKDRIEESYKRKLPPMFLYPEGTTTNGRALLKFKRGGFSHKRPVKIYVLEHKGRLINSFTNIYPPAAGLLTLSQFYNEIVVHEVEEGLDPLWVAEIHGLDENDPELWKYFAEETRKIMGWIGDMNVTNEGYRDIVSFEKMESRKHFKIKMDVCNREGQHKDKAVKGQSELLTALDK